MVRVMTIYSKSLSSGSSGAGSSPSSGGSSDDDGAAAAGGWLEAAKQTIMASSTSASKEGVAAGAALGLMMWMGIRRWHVCRPDQYLVRTGFCIKDMNVCRNGIQWPFQQAELVRMSPQSFRFELSCLSKSYLPFDIPVTCTVAPMSPVLNLAGFKRYCERMQNLAHLDFQDTILGIVHGETRVLATQMEIDSITDDREAFREGITTLVQKQLDKLGIEIVNVNIAELKERDRGDHSMGYLEARERKKLADAVQDSEIDVAEARKRGTVGQKSRERDTRIAIAAMERDAKLKENEQLAIVAQSKAELAVVEGDADRKAEIARIEAQHKAEVRNQQLLMDVEILRQKQMLAAKQADVLTSAQVEAQAVKVEADGRLYAAVKDAEAKLAMMKAEASGLRQKMEQEGEGLHALLSGADGDEELTKQYLYLRADLPQYLADAQARALKGLQPKVWAFNSGDAGAGAAAAPDMVNQFLKGFAPSIQMVKDSGIMMASPPAEEQEHAFPPAAHKEHGSIEPLTPATKQATKPATKQAGDGTGTTIVGDAEKDDFGRSSAARP